MSVLRRDISKHPFVSETAFCGSYYVINDVTGLAIESHPSKDSADRAAEILNDHEGKCKQRYLNKEPGAVERIFYKYSVVEA